MHFNKASNISYISLCLYPCSLHLIRLEHCWKAGVFKNRAMSKFARHTELDFKSQCVDADKQGI